MVRSAGRRGYLVPAGTTLLVAQLHDGHRLWRRHTTRRQLWFAEPLARYQHAAEFRHQGWLLLVRWRHVQPACREW